MKIRDGQIDLAILAAPRLKTWPTQGARVLSRHCSDAGIKVGWYGGTGLLVRGAMTDEHSGGVVMAEDPQRRLHRIRAKAIVKIVPRSLQFPNPFSGWYSAGLIPLTTARKLLDQGTLTWQPAVVILGSGNQALRLGSEILERFLSARVVCVESVFETVQGWEVEKRRFEEKGGKIIFAKPQKLAQKSAILYELTLKDAYGERVFETARVVSVGPFEADDGFREYPAGSLFFDWENSEAGFIDQDVEGILFDEYRAIILASRIAKSLPEVKNASRSQLERALWQSKQKLKEMESLPLHRFAFQYDGKWLSESSKKELLHFGGVPKNLAPEKVVASIECIEPIACKECQRVCPAGAIDIDRSKNQFLFEDRCTGCGFCLQICPSEVPVMIRGDSSESFTSMIFSYREKRSLKKGDRVALLSRKGEVLAQTRVLDEFLDGEFPLLTVEVPSHLIWEARSIVSVSEKSEVELGANFYAESGVRVDVQIQGQARRVKDGQNVCISLFEIGVARPNDILICEDGSCGLCQVEIDGVRKFACQATLHQGMSLRFTRDHLPSSDVCPCEDVSQAHVEKLIQGTSPDTMEALAQVCTAGQGKCHGLICQKPLQRIARENGVHSERYADRGFPWVDWVMKD